MPYKHETEHLRLSPQQDRRRKLTDEQKEEIRQLYADGKGSWQALADRYHVSKKTIDLNSGPPFWPAVDAEGIATPGQLFQRFGCVCAGN